MFVSDYIGVEDTRCGVEGIHSGVDTQLGNTTGQYSRGVQMGESGGRGRICQIVSRYVDSLERWK